MARGNSQRMAAIAWERNLSIQTSLINIMRRVLVIASGCCREIEGPNSRSLSRLRITSILRRFDNSSPPTRHYRQIFRVRGTFSFFGAALGKES